MTLRTLGLLSLMHQAGLHVPAVPGSRLPVWRTCSPTSGTSSRSPSRSRRSPGTCARSCGSSAEAGPATLVLLDELGAGTDPTEGSALAQALLDHFISAGALVAATTHYAELKATPTPPRRAERGGRVRPRDPVADLPAVDRPARRQPGVRHRRAARVARGDRRRCPLAPDEASRRSRRPSPRSCGRPSRARGAGPGPRRGAAGGGSVRESRTRSVDGRGGSATRSSAAARAEAERIVEDSARTRVRGPPKRSSARRSPCRRGRRGRAGRGRLERLPAADASRRRRSAAPVRVAARRPRAEPQRRLGRPDRGARARRHAGDTGGRRDACQRDDDLELPAVRRAGTASARRDRTRHERSRPSGHRRLRLDRAASVASSLDARGAGGRGPRGPGALPGRRVPGRPGAGVIIHGLGTGALRDAVRRQAAANPWSGRSGRAIAARAVTGRRS